MNTVVIILFIIAYIGIVFEHVIHINKAAIALIFGSICWTVIGMSSDNLPVVINDLQTHMIDIGELVFFLLGAMTIVELIDAHDGFQTIAEIIKTTNKTKLVWTIALVSFFLSAILDNLTTTIVMVSILNKLIEHKKTKWLLLGLIIISANAGGAWSPIGDVTTTMLWIGGQITSWNIIQQTFLASFTCMAIPTLIINYKIDSTILISSQEYKNENFIQKKADRNIVLIMGICCFLMIPIFHQVTHLPPFMGMLFCLGLMWMLTGILHHRKSEEEKGVLSVNHALRKIDVPSILFFTGILLCVTALEVTGTLTAIAHWMDHSIGNLYVINGGIGLLSSVLDNIPLVAGIQNMYPLSTYPTDHYFWELLTFCAGTGGSCLIIGSAAGVVVMGLEKMSFIWYLKNITWIALVGFISGIGVFVAQHLLT